MFERIYLILTFSIISLLQVGCATYQTEEEYAAKLTETVSVEREISEFVYSPFLPNEWTKFELGADANVFDFGSGKAFFAAFELVNISMPATLEVRSAFNTVFQASGHVVIPTILILDSEYSVVSKTESQMRQTSAPSGSTEFSHVADIDGDAAFVVVYSDPSTANRTIPWHFSFYASTPINVGTESNTQAEVGVGGPMRIKIAPREE